MHMNFSEDAQHNYFFSQPHQPFFVLAFVSAIVTMFIFMLSFKGVIRMDISAIDYHSYGLIYLLFTPAFFGFLFTTFPRFSSTTAIDKKVYMKVFTFYYIGATLFLLGSIASPILGGFGMIIVFIGNLFGVLILKNIYTTTKMEDTHDLLWIFSAMAIGLGSHILFIIGAIFHIGMVGFAIEVAIYLYLFLVAFSVAQRMVPFFSHSMAEKNTSLLKTLFILLVLHVISEGFISNASFIFDLITGVLLIKEIIRWKLPLLSPNPLLLILHISLYWAGVAFIIGGVSNFLTLVFDTPFLALDVHILVLGFVFTILIGFGTRVTLGHSGNMMQSDNWIKGLFIWTQVVVLVRVLVSLFVALGWDFMIIFDISVMVWFLMFIAWAIRFFDVLVRGKKLTT